MKRFRFKKWLFSLWTALLVNLLIFAGIPLLFGDLQVQPFTVASHPVRIVDARWPAASPPPPPPRVEPRPPAEEPPPPVDPPPPPEEPLELEEPELDIPPLEVELDPAAPLELEEVPPPPKPKPKPKPKRKAVKPRRKPEPKPVRQVQAPSPPVERSPSPSPPAKSTARSSSRGRPHSQPAAVPSEMGIREVQHPPRLVRKVEPAYPRTARRRGITGTVRIKFLVDKGGRVTKASVVGASPPGIFEKDALRAVRQWRFKPGVHRGRPVSVWAVQIIHFKLSG